MPRMTQLQREERGPATSFHRFGRLAPELRQAVWRATWSPRDVNPRLKRVSSSLVTVGANLPITSQVNQESRKETLHCYQLSLSINSYPTRVFFNFNIDTLYLPTRNRQLRNMFSKDDLVRLQSVSVPEWLPVGLIRPQGGELDNAIWSKIFAIPRSVISEELLENHDELQPGQELLCAAQGQMVRNFPGLKQLFIRPIIDLSLPEAKDRLQKGLLSWVWFKWPRVPKVMKLPRFGREDQGRESLKMYFGRIKDTSLIQKDTLTQNEQKVLVQSLEWVFGCTGFTSVGLNKERLEMLHKALGIPVPDHIRPAPNP